jgi:hypothetical protein
MNAISTGTNEWNGLTKREYVAIEAMSALIKVYGAKAEGHHKDPTSLKKLAYANMVNALESAPIQYA